METTLYLFVVAIFIILISFIVLLFWLFKSRWKFIFVCVVAGAVGGIAGYFVPSNETNIMVARILNREVMIELSIEQVHLVIGSAVGLLIGVFLTEVQPKRKRYVSKNARA
jgi:membrane protein YqaA with SNARE-associated domain